MARLEEAHLGRVSLPLDVAGAVAIPEPSSDVPATFSPTSSLDSAIGDSPRPAGNSGKYIAYGGPGFSLACFDAVTGNAERIPVPLPLSCAQLADCITFTQSRVLCAAVVGETQVWVGTETGSLHVFELSRHLRFSSHSVTTMDGSLLCIASQLPNTGSLVTSTEEEVGLQSALRDLRIDILLGTSNGAVAIISGEAEPSGGLREPGSALRKPRKVLYLSDREGEEARNVNCIAATQNAKGDEVFWCSYGKMIVVLSRDGWQELGRVDGSVGLSKSQSSLSEEIAQLVASEHGMWSALSLSSSVTLWDTELLTQKLTIACCTLCEVDLGLPMTSHSLQITSLHSALPYLLVGTSESDLLIFRVHRRQTASTAGTKSNLTSSVERERGSPDVGYRFVTAEHCSQGPILNIFTNPVRTTDEECRSPFHSVTATPTSLQVLVVCGPRVTSSSGGSSNTVLFFDLLLSPSVSPLISPLQLPTPTRPLSASYRRCSSAASNSSVSSSSTVRRRSTILSDGSLPKLSLFSASPSAHSLLPLRSS